MQRERLDLVGVGPHEILQVSHDLGLLVCRLLELAFEGGHLITEPQDLGPVEVGV